MQTLELFSRGTVGPLVSPTVDGSPVRAWVKYPIIYRVFNTTIPGIPGGWEWDFWSTNSRLVDFRTQKVGFNIICLVKKHWVQFIFPKYQGWVENHKMQKILKRQPPASYGTKYLPPQATPCSSPVFFQYYKQKSPLKKNHDSNHVKIHPSSGPSFKQNPKVLESRRVFVPSYALLDWTIDICTHNEGLSPRKLATSKPSWVSVDVWLFAGSPPSWDVVGESKICGTFG